MERGHLPVYDAKALRHERQAIACAQIAHVAFVTAVPRPHVPYSLRQPLKRVGGGIIARAEPAEHVSEAISSTPRFVSDAAGVEQTWNTCKADCSAASHRHENRCSPNARRPLAEQRIRGALESGLPARWRHATLSSVPAGQRVTQAANDRSPNAKPPAGGAGSFRGLRTAAERVASSQHPFLCLMGRYATPASGAGPPIKGAATGAERSSASAMAASRCVVVHVASKRHNREGLGSVRTRQIKKAPCLGEAGCLSFGGPGFRGGEAPGPDEKRAPLTLVPGVWLRQWISSLSARAKRTASARRLGSSPLHGLRSCGTVSTGL